MKIAIRVDASTKIGLGHIKRCLALAEGLREFGAAVLFVTRDLGVDIDNYVLSAGFEIVKLKGEENNSTSEISDPHAVWKNVALRNDALETVAAARLFSKLAGRRSLFDRCELACRSCQAARGSHCGN